MTVLARPSANGTHRWPAVALAALLCGGVIIGCSSGGGGPSASGAASRDPVPSTQPSACSPWAGLNDLFSVTTWLQQMIGDEVIFGAGTEQAKRDGLAVVVYAGSLDGLSATLPPQEANDLRDFVLPVAASPYKKTPEQLNTAANDAKSLATQISRLCPSA
jgi:hypothetical protein